MSREVVFVDSDTSVEAARRLGRKCRSDHLLVVQGDVLVGVVCVLCDLAGAAPHDLIGSFMHGPVVTADIADSPDEAIALMGEKHVGCLPVLVGTLVLGIVTREELQCDDRLVRDPAWEELGCGD
jgi:CBS domain-containing protein